MTYPRFHQTADFVQCSLDIGILPWNRFLIYFFFSFQASLSNFTRPTKPTRTWHRLHRTGLGRTKLT